MKAIRPRLVITQEQYEFMMRDMAAYGDSTQTGFFERAFNKMIKSYDDPRCGLVESKSNQEAHDRKSKEQKQKEQKEIDNQKKQDKRDALEMRLRNGGLYTKAEQDDG